MSAPRTTLRSEFERAERFAKRAFAAEAQITAVTALLERAEAGEHAAPLTTTEIRTALASAQDGPPSTHPDRPPTTRG